MSGEALNLDAIEDEAEKARRFLRNVRLSPETALALVGEVRRLRAQALGPEPRCRKGNVLKYHANPCGVGCEYPAPSP